MSVLLEIKNLAVQFQARHAVIQAVDGIHLTINRGEAIGLVGESGSGKSVTALAVMRLLSKQANRISGSVLLHSNSSAPVDLLKVPEQNMNAYRGSRIAMIFQEPMSALNPVFKCGVQVSEAIRLHQQTEKNEAKEQVIALFRKTGLTDPERIYNAYPHQLSGGQKQRVLIAMAISCNPDLLIADEPTTALDVMLQATVLSLLKDIQKETGMAMLFISHDLAVVGEIASRIAVMRDGKIVEDNPVDKIYSSPQHPYTKALLACKPPLGIQLKRLPVLTDFLSDGSNENPFESYNSVENVIAAQVVSQHETEQHRKALYAHKPILEVKNLYATYAAPGNLFFNNKKIIAAVDHVSFDIYLGESLGLVGESGCGKTTLAKTIVRIIEPANGKIIFNGTDLANLDRKNLLRLRKSIQFIFQDPYAALNPKMTVGEAILEPMKAHAMYRGSEKREILNLLARIGLSEKYVNRYPHELSGGQRQRVCIARALALKPALLICDEPVSSLDVSVQAQMLNLLNDLKHDLGFASLFISHDISVVKFMCDRIMVMKNGQIEEAGYANEICAHPQTAYTRQLITAIPKGYQPMSIA